jgi:methyl-accepting chemotaxis protein
MKLRLKILIFIILSTAIVFVISIGFVNYRYWIYSKKLAFNISDLYAKQNATNAQSILMADMKVVQTLEQSFIGYDQIPQKEREKIYNNILKNILENNPNFLAVWMSWELNAINPNWKLPYGRRRTAAFWNFGNIKIKIDSANLNGDVPGSPYFLLKSGVEKSLLTDPYFFAYTQDTGATFLETSLARGIYKGGKFVGAVGIDVSLKNFNNILKQLKPFSDSKIIIVSNNGTIVASENTKSIGEKLNKIYPQYEKYKIIEQIKEGKKFSFNYPLGNNKYEYISFHPIKIEGSNLPWSLGFIVNSDIITKSIRHNSMLMLIFSLFSLLFISIIIWISLSIIIKPIEKTTKALELLSIGDISETLKVNYTRKDELGRMAKAINKLINALISTQHFASEIGKGNLHTEYKLLSKKDKLGISLVEMRDNLLKAQKEEKIRQEENEKLNWLQKGITEINEILRENSDNLNNLTYEITKFLVNYTSSVQGGFYLLETKENQAIIVLKSAYAYDRKKEMTAEIEIGEGLIGRAVKEKRIINIENLPEGYTFIRSGLGEKSPDNLIIVPLLFEGEVLGAIEIAGFNKFDEFKVDFLNQISVRITSSISVLLKNLETEKLLKESQLQTATFEMKERQFVRSRKKIAQQQKELKIKNEILEKNLNAIKILGSYIELDTNKKIIDTNEFIPKYFEISKDELLGKTIDDITIFIKGSKLWTEKFWEDIKKGQLRKKTTTYIWNDKKIKLLETFFLIKDTDNKEKIIIIGIEQKNNQ